MIELGSCDAGITQQACDAYAKQVEAITRVKLSGVTDGPDKLAFRTFQPGARQSMTVAQIQQALTSIGFSPGADIDGICGYRSLSAIRLFQEYVRTVEQLPCDPDGCVGPQTQAHIERWLSENKQPEWSETVAQWDAGALASTEYTQWLSLLNKVKGHYLGNPNRMLSLVNSFPGQTDTEIVAQWDFDPRHMHLIGIRRDQFSGKFDDVMILLIKGLVFKFQGSTEPGASTNPNGTPFLVQGQHNYHFGWHRRQYLALRPQHLDKGVLVVRSKGDKRLDDGDLDNGLEANPSINVHWGGKGGTFSVNSWSAGCQVINGTLYINHNNDLIDCSAFVARNNSEVAENRRKSRGAYNVLLDLVTALSGNTGNSTVKYMLLNEQDLDLDSGLKQGLVETRATVGAKLGR